MVRTRGHAHPLEIARERLSSVAAAHTWNAAARLVYFLSFAFLLSYIREQLRQSKEEVKRLSGLLPICASCKKIRNDKGYWQEIESYLHSHSDTKFSHGICPECAKKLYPEFADELLKKIGHSES